MAFNGSRMLNPFKFKHYDLSEIAIYLDRQQQHVMMVIQPNFEGNWFIRVYNSLFSGTDKDKLNTDEGIGISHDNYKNGYALYAFDLTTDLDKDDHFNLVKHGNLHLSLKFNVELPEMVTVLVYAKFDNVIEMDCDCNMPVDFGV